MISRKQRAVFFEDPFFPAFLFCAAKKTRVQAEFDLCSFYNLKITAVQTLLDQLLQTGLLSLSDDRLEVDWICVSARIKGSELSGRNFLKEHLNIANTALDEQFETGGVFYSSCLSLPSEKLQECKDIKTNKISKFLSYSIQLAFPLLS